MGIDGFTVERFGYFSPADRSDRWFEHALSWSRVYEYPFVMRYLDDWTWKQPAAAVHNACWGFQDIHIVWKTWLDLHCETILHSDLRPSTLHRTTVWDVRQPPPPEWVGAWDVVVNVSAIEEVAFDHRQVIENHLVQLRPGGQFVATFDVPGFQVEAVENWVGQKMVEPPVRLNPRNSIRPDHVLNLPENYNVGYLVIGRV